jgi:hypothetical protein
MAGISNISHSPADKRGMGFTFLGMMAPDNSGSPLSVSHEEEIEYLLAQVSKLKTELRELREYVMTPWYKKLWRMVWRLNQK